MVGDKVTDMVTDKVNDMVTDMVTDKVTNMVGDMEGNLVAASSCEGQQRHRGPLVNQLDLVEMLFESDHFGEQFSQNLFMIVIGN